MQLQKLVEEGKIKDTEDVREFINSPSDEEITDELVTVQLKNFMDIRKLATEAGMLDEYVTEFQPNSVLLHGHWPALRRFYLEPCREPLHRLHLRPVFSLMPPLDPAIVAKAMLLMGDAYDIWRAKYGLEDVLEPLVGIYVTGFNEEGIEESKSASKPDSPQI